MSIDQINTNREWTEETSLGINGKRERASTDTKGICLIR